MKKRVDPIHFLIRFCLVFSILFFIARFCLRQTEGFTIAAISSNRLYDETHSTTPLSETEKEEVRQALSQPYTYQIHGGQAFACFSRDGKYVIKFFKQRLFSPPRLLNALPLPKWLHRYRSKRNNSRKDKQRRDFFSYKVAFEKLKEETAVLYSHLNPTTDWEIDLEVIDKLGISHLLNLDKFDFVLQRRGDEVYSYLHQLISSGEVDKATRVIDSLFDLISRRAKKGFGDWDPDIPTNCAILNGRAIKIDVGRFFENPHLQTVEGHNLEVTEITTDFRDWLQKTHPSLLPTFDAALQKVMLK